MECRVDIDHDNWSGIGQSVSPVDQPKELWVPALEPVEKI
jgi:hypothetical protein